MGVFISYSKFSSVTGRKLIASTGLKRAKTWVKFKRHAGRGDNIIVNWGATIGNGLTEKLFARANARIINHPDALRANKDKLGSLKKMAAGGASVVPHWAIDNVPAGEYPVIARTANHFGGSGFWKCENEEQLAEAKRHGANHATKLIVKAGEYRVHILLDKAVRIVRKVKAREDVDDLCRSHQNGWKFKKVADENVPQGIVAMAVKAVDANDMQLGAVDIVVQKRTNKMFVLEVNSVPGLEGSSLEAWTNAIKALAV